MQGVGMDEEPEEENLGGESKREETKLQEE